MNPILYDKDEVGFVSNGLARLKDCVSCSCVEERNGVFECDFEYPVDGEYFDLIQCGRIIGVTHDDSGDVQPFDIVSCTKPIDGIVSFHAVHISYRLSGIVCRANGVTGADNAFHALVETAQPDIGNFNLSTESENTTSYVAAFDGVPRSVRQMLGGIEGSILDAFGGEYEFDRWNVTLKTSRGRKRDFTIRYGVNLASYNEDTDYLSSYNACVPYWKGNDNGQEAVVYGSVVETGEATFGARTICAALDLSDKFETKPTVADLESTAFAVMRSRQTWLPSQTIKVDFVRLQDFAEFSQYESLYDCSLCDSIDVVFPRYGMSGTYKIVKTVWDVLEGRYSEMELGSLSTTLADALGISNSLGGGITETDEVDYIIEEAGTSANNTWNYRKWQSGTLECWARFYVNSMNISSTSGQLKYASVTLADRTYPVAFVSNPIVNIDGNVTNGNGWCVMNNTNYSASQMGGVYVYAPTSQTGVGVTVNVYAIGRWK